MSRRHRREVRAGSKIECGTAPFGCNMIPPMRILDALWTDVRYAVRRLRHTPRFSIPTIASLGLGIAIATAAFAVVNALLLRPAPVKDGGALLVLAASRPSSSTLRYLSYP